MRRITILLLLSALLITACSEQPAAPAIATTPQDYPSRPALDQLSQAEAIARKARVADISYVMVIDLGSRD